MYNIYEYSTQNVTISISITKTTNNKIRYLVQSICITGGEAPDTWGIIKYSTYTQEKLCDSFSQAEEIAYILGASYGIVNKMSDIPTEG